MKFSRFLLCALFCLFLGSQAFAVEKELEQPVPDKAQVALIVAALHEAANNPAKPKGDPLFIYYLQNAAEAALAIDAAQDPVGSYLVALGVFFDPNGVFSANPLVAKRSKNVETPLQRKERLRMIDEPSVSGRHDLALHFTLSAGFCEVLGAEFARSIGMLKENMDARQGGSGYSFVDLAADFAGVEFALRLQDGRLGLEQLAAGEIRNLLPRLDDLEERLFPEDPIEFQKRVNKELSVIQERVASLNYSKESADSL